MDLPWGKNLVGSFYHPDAVFIDPDVLLSLNGKFFSDGMGEVIKYGFIKDKSILELLDSCKNKEEVLKYIEDIIYKCCSIKKELVEKDERDLGERMMLNFGHTLAHGIEKYYNYDKYSHGEAVAIGMAHMTNITERMDITKKGTYDYMKSILTKYGLPVNIPDIDKQALVNSIALDKKSSGDRINIIIIEEAGVCRIIKIKLQEVYGFLFPEDIT